MAAKRKASYELLTTSPPKRNQNTKKKKKSLEAEEHSLFSTG
jgi:hypothetical protein